MLVTRVHLIGIADFYLKTWDLLYNLLFNQPQSHTLKNSIFLF